MSIIKFPRRGLPWRQDNLTLYLIIINVVISVIDLILKNNLVLAYLGMIPGRIIIEGFIWTPLTYMFVHANIVSGGPWHILFNMLGLFFIGRELERQMGSLQFLFYYLGVGFVAGCLSFGLFALMGAYGVPLIGASGAIYGLLLAYACFYPWRQLLVFGVIPVRAPLLVIGYAGIDILMEFSGRGGNVAHATHLFGLLAGFLIMLIVYRINFFSTLRRRN